MSGIWRISLLLLALSTLLAGGCATLPDNSGRVESYALTDTGDTRIAKARRAELEAHPGQSGFFLLSSGLDAFVARALLAQAADRSIDAQYYLLHSDLTGILFIDQLRRAADRGVRIRLLVDDMDLADKELDLAVLDTHPFIEVRAFNPFSRNVNRAGQMVTGVGKVTRRMHNKSFTADNQATIVGGRNIGNEYFDADPDLEFSDLDVLAVGPVVRDVSKSFDLYWNSELAYPISLLVSKSPTPEQIEKQWAALDEFVAEQEASEYMHALRNSDFAARLKWNAVHLQWGNAQVVYDRPEKLLHDKERTDLHLSAQLGPHLNGVSKELIIFSPYFVPGKKGVKTLTELRERGVRVRILTNSLASTDVSVVHAGYAPYRKDLLRAGVELFELNKKLTRKQRKEMKGSSGSSKASLHAKSFVLDRSSVFIGSLNLDPRSVYENTEIGIVLENKDIAAAMAKWFDENIADLAFRLELDVNEQGGEKILWHGLVDGEKQVFTVDPYTTFWRRFGVGFLSLLPIESQL